MDGVSEPARTVRVLPLPRAGAASLVLRGALALVLGLVIVAALLLAIVLLLPIVLVGLVLAFRAQVRAALWDRLARMVPGRPDASGRRNVRVRRAPAADGTDWAGPAGGSRPDESAGPGSAPSGPAVDPVDPAPPRA